MSLEDIGDKFGLTRERVRQIKDKAINKLRGTSKSKLSRARETLRQMIKEANNEFVSR